MSCHGGRDHGVTPPTQADPSSSPMGGAYVQWDSAVPNVFFSWWTASTTWTFWTTVVLLFIIAVLYEYLAYFRQQLELDSHSSAKQDAVDASPGHVINEAGHVETGMGETEPMALESASRRRHAAAARTGRAACPGAWQAILALVYGCQVFLAYFLMMVFMLYNGFFIVAIILGFTVGHFGVGVLRQNAGMATLQLAHQSPCH